ncbi:hypothetical protein J2Z34_000022 [Youngiibacter multivorans]|uniref:Uncharacterized protein n=1 Tax=Youngiibacter multivorans TaxID=937251 RepID=A0ABS4FZ34_9CLOT|nr:hypothetical protein [Youngiibacter multivorans]
MTDDITWSPFFRRPIINVLSDSVTDDFKITLSGDLILNNAPIFFLASNSNLELSSEEEPEPLPGFPKLPDIALQTASDTLMGFIKDVDAQSKYIIYLLLLFEK